MIIGLPDAFPDVHHSAWIALNATVVGNVTIKDEVGVWYCAVIRAETAPIAIGARSNVQDGCVLHTDPGHPISIGESVSIGHNAVLHGCTIGDNVLVGMGALILNGAKIGNDCLVAAGAVVPQGAQIPAGSLVAGVPAKVRRNLTGAEIDHVRGNAADYVHKRLVYTGICAGNDSTGKLS